ncbi:response regulator [Paenibacillus sp.]|uniref:response regulator n=1 Tax=Paenibacillus sp. TaxID=58172 RepID=UPI002D683D04|nr:response regulator [Paenibacillus sp.]HZG56995.1 response regulator [Paenibacillus sp.]
MATILIVDDSILMRRNLRMMLTEAGHEIVGEASNGIEAYKEYVKTMPDIVTMDITMPVMSGIDAVKKIIASYPEANIVMISALDQRSMVFDAIQNGAKHYILKPITAEKVLHTINEVLHQETAAEEAAAGRDSSAGGAAGTTAPAVPPFEITNKNGVFVVALRPSIGPAEWDAIGGAVAGFQYIKPLKVVFHFAEPEGFDDEALSRVAGFVKLVLNAGGAARTVSAGKVLNARLKTLDPDLFSTIYTELSQIVI